MSDTASECLARRWHDLSDHAADGTPFGGGVCNCEALAPRLATIIAGLADDEELVERVTGAIINNASGADRNMGVAALRALAAALATES